VKFKFNNTVSTKIIPSITFADLRKVLQAKKQPTINTEKPIPDYSLILKKELKTAIIDFRYFNDEAKFKVFIDSTFDVIKKDKIENIIIDIRENGGGNSLVGDQLFKYISKEKFTQFGKTIIKYSQLQKDFYKVNCEDDSTNCETYNYLKKQENGKTEVIENENLISPNTNQFNGKIFLLTSLKTFSSASTFAQCFKNYKMGTIVGEETGGWIVAYGDKITTTLPVTNLTITISQKKFYTVGATDKDFHGIIPDIKINSENALDFTLKKIASTK
jgi:C-terminal processing protease CtpA/Prc